jgi:hypothetical protein
MDEAVVVAFIQLLNAAAGHQVQAVHEAMEKHAASYYRQIVAQVARHYRSTLNYKDHHFRLRNLDDTTFVEFTW